MNDQKKTKRQLIDELGELRRRVAELEAAPSRPTAGDEQWESNDLRWHSLVANTPVFILILDREHRIRFANHTDSGAATTYLIGKLLYDFCLPELRANIRECVERVFQTGKPDLCEGPAVRADLQEHWYATYFGPIFEDGRVVAVSAIAINITERKRVEQALRESERRVSTLRLQAEVEQRRRAEADRAIYRRFVEASSQGFGMADVEGRIIYVNPFLARLFGAPSPADVIGTRVGAYYPTDYVVRRAKRNSP
jgi:PAS domain S-box-containing protein